MVVGADEAGEAEEVEDPPDEEAPGGEPKANLCSGAAEVEIMPAEEEPREEGDEAGFLLGAEFLAEPFFLLAGEGFEKGVD